MCTHTANHRQTNISSSTPLVVQTGFIIHYREEDAHSECVGHLGKRVLERNERFEFMTYNLRVGLRKWDLGLDKILSGSEKNSMIVFVTNLI